MRTGDTVLHRPSGEAWLVAYVDGPDLAWFGWPEGFARVDDCELVKACSDEEHEKALRKWTTPMRTSDSGGYDRRSTICARQLEALLARRAAE